MRERRLTVHPMRNPSPLLATVGLFAVGAAACNVDVFDVDVPLSPHAYQADFGASSGTIPTVACDATMPTVCGTGQTLAVTTTDVAPADVSVDVGCDATTSRCFAEAHARLTYELDVLQDDAFVTKVERRAISVVRSIDLAYTLPTNTLTFDVPRIDVYVGPVGTKTETDPGVAFVDSVQSITAGLTFGDDARRHLTLADDSPARTLIASSIQAKTPFVFVLVTAPRLDAGAPVPGGAFEIDVYPTLGLGLE
jgi:hypothetical protein